jgi:flagellar hook protein FlgE
VYFAKHGVNHWAWHAVVDGSEVADGTRDVPFEGARGELRFSTDGTLASELQTPSPLYFSGATPGQPVLFDFGTIIETEQGDGLDGTTAFASASTTNGVLQDGFAAGGLSGFSIRDDGVLTSVYSNGEQRTAAVIPLARFYVDTGLTTLCDGLWTDSQHASDAVVGYAATAGRGLIQSALVCSGCGDDR